MVEVDRVVDARGPQGVALQVQRLGAVGLRDAGVADQHVSQTKGLRHMRGPAGTFILVQITMRSISSPVTVSAVRS